MFSFIEEEIFVIIIFAFIKYKERMVVMLEYLQIYYYLWFFVIYAFIGWCAEVVYAVATIGKFVNRGFLNGPICPIYGFGIIMVVLCLTPIQGNLFLLFLGSVLLTSFLEWITGFVLEKVFHNKWWDYSDKPFNIRGYVCLAFSIMWGLSCIFIIRVIHPMISLMVFSIPSFLGNILLAILLLLFAVDTIVTIVSVLDLNKRLDKIEKIAANIRNLSDEMGVNLSKTTLAVIEENEKLKDMFEERMPYLEELMNKQKELILGKYFAHNRLIKAFPTLKSKKFSNAIEKLRMHI